MTTAFKNS